MNLKLYKSSPFELQENIILKPSNFVQTLYVVQKLNAFWNIRLQLAVKLIKLKALKFECFELKLIHNEKYKKKMKGQQIGGFLLYKY